MNLFITKNWEISESKLHNVSAMLFVYGLGKTLDYFCTISVFSID